MALYLINADDPRGKKVYLWEERFYSHIAPRHPSATIESIRKTIESPDIITRDAKFPSRDNYYGWDNDSEYPNTYMKVVWSLVAT
jgi:hypothetical protein